MQKRSIRSLLRDTKYFPFLAILVVLSILWFAELLLIERKYDLFRGGFLQSHQLVGFSQIGSFLISSLVIDFLVVVITLYLWMVVWRRLSKNMLVALYNYSFIFSTMIVVVVSAKYQILSYFSDTINFAIAKNLGGGNLAESMLYISEEATLIGIVISCLFAVYFVGRKLVKAKISPKYTPDELDISRISTLLSYKTPVIAFVLCAVIIPVANLNENVRWGLSKKIAYQSMTEIFNLATDFDRDGFSSYSFPKDIDAFDAAKYPGAVDIPNNGIDENGIGGDFKLTAAAVTSHAQEYPKLEDENKQHVIIVVLESARADMLSKRVDGKIVAPNLDKMAAQGSSLEAYSHTGYTTSSLKAIFTGELNNFADQWSLFKYFDEQGYNIAVFSGQDEAFGGINEVTNMKQISDHFYDARVGIEKRVFANTMPGSLRLDEFTLTEEIERYLSSVDVTKPQMMYINFQAGHFPYSHPGISHTLLDNPIPRSSISSDEKEWLQKTYWNALAHVDTAIGKLVDILKKRAMYDNALILVLGDHGESLFDDGFLGHGHAVNSVQTKIPFVINKKGIHYDYPIGQIDVHNIIINYLKRKDPAFTGTVPRDFIFQVVGTVHEPILLGILDRTSKRTVFDYRSQKVYFEPENIWKKIGSAIQDAKFSARTRKLVSEWETLRWQGSQQNKKLN